MHSSIFSGYQQYSEWLKKMGLGEEMLHKIVLFNLINDFFKINNKIEIWQSFLKHQ